jgi:hypothetical protein
MDPCIRTLYQRSQASRLNHLVCEVMAVAPPQVAYSFVTNNLPTLHTFDRAGAIAGTRRATKSQASRCSYLSENAPIREECFRNLSYPFVVWGSWPFPEGAPALPSQLTQPWPKKPPALAIQRFLPALWDQDTVICTIPLCVAETLIR